MKLVKVIYSFICLLIFISCGSSSSKVLNSAILLDAHPVVGLKYKCSDSVGVSNQQGFFFYSKGDSCEFYLGANKLIATPKMLDDNIVTTFEITNSLKASFQLSKVFQSIAVNNGNYLILDSYAVNGMKALDLSNSKQVDMRILATGHREVLLENVIKSLSKRFNINTGKILLRPKPKQPIVQPKQPIEQPKQPISEKPKQLKKDPNICLPGVVSCVSATLPKEDKLCLPEEPCDIQITKKPCIPGVICTSSIEEKVMKNSLEHICLPGRICLKTLQDNLPGSFESIPDEDKVLKSSISTSEPCLPGMQCIHSQDVFKKKTICMPGEIC
jgi:hypothetical protein